MPEIGNITGAAVDMQFADRINQLRYHEQESRRAQQISEAKAKMFADDMDFQNAANSHDAPIIKTNSNAIVAKVGQFIRDNPDYATNTTKLTQLNTLKRELKDNVDLTRGLASDTAYKSYLKDLQEVAKNPQQHDTEAYNDVQNQWNNYLQFGNQDGQEAAQAQGKKSFLYTKPKDFVDLNERWKTIGNGFKDVITKPIKGGRNAYEEVANPKSLDITAQQEYQQNKRQYDLLAQKQGINPIDYIKTGINSNIAKKRDFGDYGLSDALYLQQYKARKDGLDRPVNKSAYQEAFVNAKEGVVSPQILEQTYSTKPKNIIYNNKGENQIDNTGNRIFYTGVHKWIERRDAQGRPVRQKVVEIYSYLPKDDAEQKGIYDGGTFGFGKGISPEWNKQAEIVNVGEGDKQQEVVKVKSLMPVELNEAYAGAFDTEAHLTKSKLMDQSPQESGGGEIPTGTLSDWKSAGWNDEQIKQGISQGKIKVR